MLNGYGKSVGLMQIDELGTLETPVLLTSTLNVPRVADALISYMLDQEEQLGRQETVNPAEEAILDALFAAETLTGRDGHVMPALPIEQTLGILRRHGVPVR